MQKFLMAATLASIALTAALPAYAAINTGNGLFDASSLSTDFDRRRPRVPGGSGCDDPHDIIEHPKACTPK